LPMSMNRSSNAQKKSLDTTTRISFKYFYIIQSARSIVE